MRSAPARPCGTQADFDGGFAPGGSLPANNNTTFYAQVNATLPCDPDPAFAWVVARFTVEGTTESVERTILDAARGSIMEFAWFVDADTGERIGVNPEHVVVLRVPAS